MFSIGLTDHLEGSAERPSAGVFEEVADLVRLAAELGVEYAWFAEHHAHLHHGHLPTPLLYALHLAGRTSRIKLGTAIICLNLHHPLDVAEQVAVADALTGGRMAPGFGSGSMPEEVSLFGLEETYEAERHLRFGNALRSVLEAWGVPGARASGPGEALRTGETPVPRARILPQASPDLPRRCWVAVNSVGSARIAGQFGFSMLFSHLRTPAQYREYAEAYRHAGGAGLIAANRPVFVGPDDAAAFRIAEPALRTLWRRFQKEGKIAASIPEPASVEGLCAHPVNFVVGGPESVARQLRALHDEVAFDVANVELRWAGLTHEQVCDSCRRLMRDVMPLAG
jgi:alkanesulfonate monooxygenase SsuD/methylene tetrahydromethanopterin reductase-like flavin-dependent oxidoreductase (luciferase family)